MRTGVIAGEVLFASAQNDKIEPFQLKNLPFAVADLVLDSQTSPLSAGKVHCLAAFLGTESSFGFRRQSNDFVERHTLVGTTQPHADKVSYFHLLFDLLIECLGNK